MKTQNYGSLFRSFIWSGGLWDNTKWLQIQTIFIMLFVYIDLCRFTDPSTEYFIHLKSYNGDGWSLVLLKHPEQLCVCQCCPLTHTEGRAAANVEENTSRPGGEHMSPSHRDTWWRASVWRPGVEQPLQANKTIWSLVSLRGLSPSQSCIQNRGGTIHATHNTMHDVGFTVHDSHNIYYILKTTEGITVYSDIKLEILKESTNNK